LGGTPAPGGAAREGLEAQILDYWGLLWGPRAASRGRARTRRAPTGRPAACAARARCDGLGRYTLSNGTCWATPAGFWPSQMAAGRLQRRLHGCGAMAPRAGRRAGSRLLGTSATQQRGAPRSPPARAARNARGGAICGAPWAQASTTRRATPRATWRRTVGGGCRVLTPPADFEHGALFPRFKNLRWRRQPIFN